ncbi:PepSY domain-containing protein [Lacticaseibacillus camelliae]|uniref:PepSY domain-containing protein n=1 Tax=Lacticaseibacillus camelliae DSM 22697 = JCM 13995 TaxID=1423730 RepID=A0A0R2ER74_9LACO|nr:PepSY domain-containing protein [Lacticaseibacillus camelliae]KRN18761.1 hypothetical protein FC75_GL000532 [Lacticaseibacillus camelliae DSM 22697 = JCM 13995]
MIKRVLITVVALTTLGLAACGHDDDDHEAKDKSSQTTKSSQSTKSSRSSSSKVAQTLPKQTLDQAWDVFVKAHPDAQVTAVKLDRETGTYRYEITGNVGTTEHEMTINGDTGETIQDEEDSTDDNDPVIKRAGLKPLKDITAAATKKLAGSTATEWDLDTDNGQVQWEVSLQHDSGEHVVHVDAYSGVASAAVADD